MKNPRIAPRFGGCFSREPDRIRTCDRLLRRQMLYPAELRVQTIYRGWQWVKNCFSRNRIPKDPVLALSGRQDSNLRPSGPKPDALPPAPLPELMQLSFRGKTGTRTQGTRSRPQLSRLLHYHSATFPLGCANLY